LIGSSLNASPAGGAPGGGAEGGGWGVAVKQEALAGTVETGRGSSDEEPQAVEAHNKTPAKHGLSKYVMSQSATGGEGEATRSLTGMSKLHSLRGRCGRSLSGKAKSVN
jgi:hypothetical protein